MSSSHDCTPRSGGGSEEVCASNNRSSLDLDTAATVADDVVMTSADATAADDVAITGADATAFVIAAVAA